MYESVELESESDFDDFNGATRAYEDFVEQNGGYAAFML